MSFKAILAFEDGSVFYGKGFGKEKYDVGELVFNTSMTGYQEIVTDPSYKKQIITFTHPHIGNTGVCLLYTSPSPRDLYQSRIPSSA